MKTEAGWKLWTRKPSAAPAVIAASTPAASRPRSKAMMAERHGRDRADAGGEAVDAVAQGLTTFITATRPSTVSGPPRSPKSTGAEERAA